MSSFWSLAAQIGYEPLTAFWDDFSMAEPFGPPSIKDTAERAWAEWKDDYKFATELVISPESFYQINHDQTEKLYSLAIEAANLKPGEKILDAYCGIGTIGLCAAKKAEGVKLTGVELNRAAVSDARENAKANGMGKARFIAGDATKFMIEEAAKKSAFDVVFLDPPRSGTTPEFIAACEKLSPSRIVYVSCDPTTLARDLKEFKKHGYKAGYAVPVDMFPLTEHVENVVLLNHLDSGI